MQGPTECRPRADDGVRTRRLLVGSQASLHWDLIRVGGIGEHDLAGSRRAPIPIPREAEGEGIEPPRDSRPGCRFRNGRITALPALHHAFAARAGRRRDSRARTCGLPLPGRALYHLSYIPWCSGRGFSGTRTRLQARVRGADAPEPPSSPRLTDATADLADFPRCGTALPKTIEGEWTQPGSNRRPSRCHRDALPTAPWALHLRFWPSGSARGVRWGHGPDARTPQARPRSVPSSPRRGRRAKSVVITRLPSRGPCQPQARAPTTRAREQRPVPASWRR